MGRTLIESLEDWGRGWDADETILWVYGANEDALHFYRDLGFESFDIKFSTRPEVRAGSDEVWDKAEAALEAAVPEHHGWPEPYLFFGGVHTVAVSADGRFDGAGDPRRGGVARFAGGKA